MQPKKRKKNELFMNTKRNIYDETKKKQKKILKNSVKQSIRNTLRLDNEIEGHPKQCFKCSSKQNSAEKKQKKKT